MEMEETMKQMKWEERSNSPEGMETGNMIRSWLTMKRSTLASLYVAAFMSQVWMAVECRDVSWQSCSVT